MGRVDSSHLAVGFQSISDHHIHGNTIAEGIVDAHDGVLQADRAVPAHHRGLAFDLGVAVRHGRPGLFMHYEDVLGVLVAAIVYDGFLYPRAPAGQAEEVFEAEGFEDVNHEVGTGAAGDASLAGFGNIRRRRPGRDLLSLGDWGLCQ